MLECFFANANVNANANENANANANSSLQICETFWPCTSDKRKQYTEREDEKEAA